MAALLVPEREVLRVERAPGEHRLFTQPLPVDAVGRHEGDGRLAAEGLVLFAGLAVRVRVDERREVVRLGPAPDDVVRRRPLEREQAQRRLLPVYPVGALRVAGRLVRVVVAPVVHAVQVAVLEHGEVGGGRIFPGLFEPQDDLGLSWTVQHQRGAGCDVHEPVVDEELAFGADLDRDRRRSGRRRRRRLISRLRHRRFGCRLGRRDGRGGRAGGQQAGRQRLGAAGRRGGCRNEQRRADQSEQPP